LNQRDATCLQNTEVCCLLDHVVQKASFSDSNFSESICATPKPTEVKTGLF